MVLTNSNNNIIYHNNFINNMHNVFDTGNNHWDQGYPDGGNYYDEYTGVDSYNGPNQDIPGSDGIGDTPYNITGDSNQDNYPFINPDYWVTIESIGVNFTYSPSNPIVNDTIHFTDTSSIIEEGMLVTWWWDFGDHYFSDLQNPVHRYYVDGIYTVSFTITNLVGSSETIQKTIIVGDTNNPPYTPSDPFPEDEESNVNTNVVLGWTGGDPDPLDTVTYAVYFGVSNPPSLVASDHTSTHYNPGTLNIKTDYYWQILAYDSHGESTSGPVWSFKTGTESMNEPPVADAGGPYTADEGTQIIFDASASFDPNGDELTYSWDFDNDGVFDDAFGMTPTYTWYDDYKEDISVEVSDGEYVDTDSVKVTVNNVAPVVDAGSDQMVLEGELVTIEPVFSDPGSADTFTAIISWGDETSDTTIDPAESPLYATHTYSSSGVYTVTVEVTDDDGESGTDTMNVNVGWLTRYDGDNNADMPTDIEIDPSTGYLLVTGRTRVYPNYDYDYVTIAYDPTDGSEIWNATYKEPNNKSDLSETMIIDPVTGYIITAGSGYVSNKTYYDIIVIAYDSNGNQIWLSQFEGTADYYDFSRGLVSDGSGTVYLTGDVYNAGTGRDSITIAYNSSNGNELWNATYGGSNMELTQGITYDSSSDKIYVTGATSFQSDPIPMGDYFTVAYNASTGSELWNVTYNGPGDSVDRPYAIAFDPLSGYIIVTGESTGASTSLDVTTIAYDTSGVQQWIKRYTGVGNNDDIASTMAINSASDVVYVAGRSTGIGTEYDSILLAYSISNGNELWNTSYNGPGNGNDSYLKIALDQATGDIFTTGFYTGIGTDYDCVVTAYDSSGNQQWIKSYNGPGNGRDMGIDIILDQNNNIYVAAWSPGDGTGIDIALMKYLTIFN